MRDRTDRPIHRTRPRSLRTPVALSLAAVFLGAVGPIWTGVGRLATPLAAQIPTFPVQVDTASQLRASSDSLTNPLGIGSGTPTAEELEIWLDGWMTARLAGDRVAGAVVSVVRGGQILLAKGYGKADVAGGVPADAERTLFRIGSISKLFVWTSVMQLVEQGAVQLDADVNDYLDDVEVPTAYERPVTLADLMTHSAGFEDHVIGLFGNDSTDLQPMSLLLNREMPARVRPPGETSAYSNHGTAIAMQVVEDVTDQPWIEYIEENILEPLRLASTTFRQPVPEELLPRLSKGYSRGGTRAQPFEYVPLAPVGAASSTATDMAAFMIAHLQMGTLRGRSILESATAQRMQSELFRNAPGANPFLHGFADLSRGDRRIIGHGGDTFWFHSQLSLLPEHDLGIFVSFNTEGGNAGALVADFLDRYFGESETPTPTYAAEDLDRFEGTFRSNRYSHSDFTKVSALVGGVSVTAEGDSLLLIDMGADQRWTAVEPLVFQSTTSDRRIAFREDADGKITHAFLADVPYLGLERVPWMEKAGVHMPLALGAGVLFLLATLGLPIPWYFRRKYEHQPEDVIPGVGRLLAWVSALGFLIFIVGFAIAMSEPNNVALGNLRGLRPLFLVLPVAAVLGVTSLLVAVFSWLSGRGSTAARIAFTLLSVAFVTFTWQLEVWNLLGWNW